MISVLNYAIYWLIVLLPFFIAIAPAPQNVGMGILIVAFLAKRTLERKPVFIKSPISVALLLLLIMTCVSLFNSIDYRDTFKGGIFRLLQYIFIFFILAQEIKDVKHLRFILSSILLGLFLCSIDSIWQVFSGRDFIRGYAPSITIGLLRATASFKDPNTFGVYLSALVPAIIGLTGFYFRGAVLGKKILCILINALLLLPAVLTYSRPTLLAIYLAFVFLSLVGKNKYLLCILIAGLLIAPFLLPRQVKEFARSVEYNPVRFMCNDDRISVFRNSWRMIAAHPVIGVGANTFMKNYKQYKENPEYRNAATSEYLYAHNNFLHITAEIGFIGLGFFVWFLGLLFLQIKKSFFLLNDAFIKAVLLSITACIIAFLVNGLTESSLYSSRVAVLFWYLCGVALSLKTVDACARELCSK